MIQNLNGSKIISLLQELDRNIQEPCRIIICGGAAAIVGYGLKRFTGDIDIFEPFPKSESFNNTVKNISESHGLDPKWINDGVKGFVDYLSPDYKKRLIPLKLGFKNLEAFIISKPDFVTMKICAWREADKVDVERIGISKEDISIINKNLAYIQRHSPDKAYKASLVLSELGFKPIQSIKPEEISTLSELVQYYIQKKGRDPELSEIREWQGKIKLGITPGFLAEEMTKGKKKDNLSKGMDI
jgi:hypothetical protein